MKFCTRVPEIAKVSINEGIMNIHHSKGVNGREGGTVKVSGSSSFLKFAS